MKIQSIANKESANIAQIFDDESLRRYPRLRTVTHGTEVESTEFEFQKLLQSYGIEKKNRENSTKQQVCGEIQSMNDRGSIKRNRIELRRTMEITITCYFAIHFLGHSHNSSLRYGLLCYKSCTART